MKNETGAMRRRPFLLHRNMAFPLGVLACLTLGSIDPASAENSRLVDRYAAEQKARRPEKQAKSDDPLGSGPLFAVVSIADQRISVYDSSGLVVRSRVSTGMRGYATPTGVFSIVQKRRWHEFNIYSGAPMPFMQRITWSGIALHAGVVPGHPASHGCIRLPHAFAERLFGATEIGQRLIIAPSDTAPIEMTHANLPAPKLSPAVGVAASSGPETPDATASVSTPQQNGAAVLEPASLHAPAEPVRLNPLEFARAMKSEANSKAKTAGRATRAAMLLIGKKTTELRMAGRKLAGAENAAEDAAGELAAAVRRLAKTDGKEAIAEASEGKSEAEAALVEAQKLKDARIAKATEAVNQAKAALAEMQKAAEEARIAKAAVIEAPKAEAAPVTEVSETKNEAAAAVTEAQKVEAAPVAEATEAKNETAAAVTEAQKTEDARMAEATEAKNEAAAAVIEMQKAEDARIAEATETKSEAEEALTEAQKAEDARMTKATETKSEAEEALTEAQKAEDERIAKATEAKSQAEAALTEAQKAVEEARAAKDARQQELAAARKAAVEAKTAGKAAAEALVEATRRLKPLSVFISRKTGRLYVRQNFEPLFDVPVSIRDAEREIGTHVYVSTRAAEDGAALYWQAVSMPVAEAPPARRAGKGRGGAQDNAPASAAPAPMAEPETAQGALDRVTIPEDTAQRLAELAWVGASVIVSDHGISGETGATTDFIILTKPRSR